MGGGGTNWLFSEVYMGSTPSGNRGCPIEQPGGKILMRGLSKRNKKKKATDGTNVQPF